MRTPSVRRGWKPGLASLAIGALALGGAVVAPQAASAAEVDVTGVTFDWGINNESNGGAYFGGCNFLSAGIAGDTGNTRVWTQADGFYSASAGNTTIVKPTADGTGLVQPTWATKCQTPTGTNVNTTASSYSQTRVQIANGSGTVDVAAGTADIEWDGSFTVAYYGGMTYWSATDPHLVVDADGTGTVTATLSGYGADMDDPEIWSTLAPREVTIATLQNVAVTANGITVTPDYLGVRIPADVDGRNPQDNSQAWAGAFPADFVRFQQETGQSSYWYSTSGTATSIQPRKVTLPLKVSYTAPEAVAITTQPAAQSVTLGAEATFTAAATGATGYQWQSAATGSSAWADIAGATAATYKVVGTTATAKQYRVVIAGAGGPVTSEAAALTVNVPTPTVTVSKTEGIDPAGEFVTVTGAGFLPNAPLTSGSRPPLAGKFTGSYIALAQSVGGTLTNHTNTQGDYTQWAVHAEDAATVGSSLTIAPDGTFTAQIKAQKFATAEGGVWGIRTYAAGGASYAPFATFTPITFDVLAPDAPAAPTAVLGADGTSVDISWTAPGDNGEAINGYDVTLTPSTGDAQTVAVSGSTLTTNIAGLTRGVSYTATVAAKNAGGSSPASAASAAVTVPAVAPSAPAAPTATAAGTESINVSWAAPYNGGSAITGYVVTVSAGGDVVKTVPVTGATTTTVDGLSAGTGYSVTVAASNTVGTSDASSATSVTTLVEAPGSLGAPAVEVASGTSLNVSWVAPADNGGSAITGYVVTVRSGSETVTSKEVGVVTTTTVDGLRPGTDYTVTVAAKNAQGTGEASAASGVVRTWSAPSAPAVTAVLEGTAGVSASWSAPADGGSAITGYVAQLLKDGSVVQTKPAAGTSVAFDGLTPGGVYTVSVTATNGVGSSAAGVSAPVTVAAVAPSAPGTPALTAGTNGTSVSAVWTAPSSTGGSAITGYTVVLIDADDTVASQDVAADARTVSFTDLAKGEYRVGVVAHTAAGSTPSELSAAVSLAGPAPAEAPAAVSDDELVGESGGDAEIIVDGSKVTITLGEEHANTWVGVTVHSDPVFLGWFLVDAAGVVTTTLPADLPAGTHHVVVQAADGTVLGYQAFTVDASGEGTGGNGNGSGTGNGSSAGGTDSTDGLATTGGDLPLGWAGLAVLLLVIGGAVVFTARRKAVSAGE